MTPSGTWPSSTGNPTRLSTLAAVASMATSPVASPGIATVPLPRPWYPRIADLAGLAKEVEGEVPRVSVDGD